MSFKPSLPLIIFLVIGLFSCNYEQGNKNQNKPNKGKVDLKQILEKGELVALIDNSSTSYFIYKGEPMGFEYELLGKFAQKIGVDLTVKPIHNLNKIEESLLNGEGEIVAANLTVTKDRKKKVNFSNAILKSKQVLVQSTAKGRKIIENPSGLIDSTIYVRKNSSFFERLENLSEEIGGNLNIKKVPGNLSVEDLMMRVNENEIPFTVADEHVAKIHKAYLRNIDIRTAISLEQQFAWALRKESTVLLDSINSWLKRYKKTLEFRLIYLKYYGNTSLFRSRVKNELFYTKSGKLSPFDEIIKKESAKIDWDWRLVASLIYQESGFITDAKAWTGAYGLMQLMPKTAENYGIDSLSSPEDNIKAGISYIKWISTQFEDKVTDFEQRQKFVMAAYNVGLGHVFDAIRLASSEGLDPTIWDNNVANMIVKKSNPEYYTKKEARYGYCRGEETFLYVKEVVQRYEHYKNTSLVE